MNIEKFKLRHPNVEQFVRENQFSIAKLEELAERAACMWNEIKSEIQPGKPGLEDRLIGHHLPEYLSERSIDLLQQCKNTYFYDISRSDVTGKYTKINIFGYLKIGERANAELSNDVFNLYVYDEKHDTRYFDLDRAIQIGLNYNPLFDSSTIVNSSMCIVFDVDATLIRALGTATVLGNEEEVETAIIRTMLDRIITMMVNRIQLSSLVDNVLSLSCGPVMKVGVNNGSEDLQKYDLKVLLQIAFIYKVWYNAINGVDDIDVEKSVESILDLVNLASRSFNATQAIPDVYNTIHSKIMNTNMDLVRYPDRMIETCMEYYRVAMNYYGFRGANGRRSHATYINRKVLIGVESVAVESIIAGIGVERNFRDRKRAIHSFIGIENIQQSTKEFDDFRRKSRGAILAKLEYKERITYVKYENDVMKFRAEAVGCRTEFTKGTILKRGDTIGRLIQMELSREHSEDFVLIMTMLDSERVTIQSELANRDLFKEKNTMLNGMIVTKNEWNY